MNTPDNNLQQAKILADTTTEYKGEVGATINVTPDTEWERQLRIDFEVAYGSMPKNFEHVPSVHISDWWLEKLSSRDTYWKEREALTSEREYLRGFREAQYLEKERVRKEVLEKVWEVFRWHNMEVSPRFQQDIDTLLDNLK